jgi:aquaporin related protein
LALTILGDVTWVRGLLLTIVQCGAACFSAYVVSVIFPTPFTVATTLSPNTSRTQGFFIETICTTELVFAIIMLAKEKHRGTFLAPVGIGLALFIGEMAAVGFTGGSLNPARSLGPAAVSRTFTKDHWIYWIGPGLGSILAVIFYKLFKVLE